MGGVIKLPFEVEKSGIGLLLIESLADYAFVHRSLAVSRREANHADQKAAP